MDTQKINDWLQIFGTFGVIASLVFVGMQLKQNQEIALAAQHQARAEATMDFYLAQAESGVPVSPYFLYTGEQQTEKDRRSGFGYANWVWTSMENSHFQYQAGFIADESWVPLRQNILNQYGVCAIRWIYERRRKYFRSSFVELVESEGDPCSTEQQ